MSSYKELLPILGSKHAPGSVLLHQKDDDANRSLRSILPEQPASPPPRKTTGYWKTR